MQPEARVWDQRQVQGSRSFHGPTVQQAGVLAPQKPFLDSAVAPRVENWMGTRRARAQVFVVFVL